MSWLIVAKMPLLISSRITSAGLTERSSASSLTVIVAGSSTAPRSRGSATWTAACWKAASRRCGFRGPRRPRVPLLLLATAASDRRGSGRSGHQLGPDAGGNLRLERAIEDPPIDRAGDAGFVPADVGATAVRPAGDVDADDAAGRANHPQELALLTPGPTGHA